MKLALVFNPGSNSLKFELVQLAPDQKIASDATKLPRASVDDIGKEPKLSVYNGREVVESRSAGGHHGRGGAYRSRLAP